jgi:CheY-like chemotaxis protein
MRIKADPSQLEQVLLNLAVNARDAMPDGGRLTITTGHTTDAAGVRRVGLSVRDSGVGMPPEVRERIFEPFYTTKETGKGTGLGLSTVYGIVTQSGGTIEVDSVVGRGTTFTVLFPSPLESPPGEPAAAADAPPPGGTEMVLLVEDDGAVRSLAEQALASCGYTVVSASGGIEGLTLARTMPRIDVLLTDVVMPHLGGPQLVKRILEKHPMLCVIYMTGGVDDAIMQLELDAGVALLRKPFTPDGLARAVRAALDGRWAPASMGGIQ